MTAGPQANVLDLYHRHARTWDRLRTGKLLERAWIDRLAALLPPAATVLDLGCGTGDPIARHLLEQGHHVTGVDGAAGMIDLARVRLPAATWHVADMRTLDLGQRFDGLVAWDSFFHLSQDDQRAMFQVFAAHAAQAAALLFTSGPSSGEAIGTFEGEALYHASLSPDEYRETLAAVGFEVAAHVAEDPDCGGHTVWLARRI